MDRRLFLAVILTVIVIVITPILFPSTPLPVPSDSARADTGIVAGSAAGNAAVTSRPETTRSLGTASLVHPVEASGRSATAYEVRDSVGVSGNHMTVWYGASGAVPLRVALHDYGSRGGDKATAPVILTSGSRQPLLQYALALPDTTVELVNQVFTHPERDTARRSSVTYSAVVGKHDVRVAYSDPTTDADRYLVHVVVEVSNAPNGSAMSIQLPRTLVSAEPDTVDDIRHLAFAYFVKGDKVRNVEFGKLDSGETKAVAGPMEWAGVRNKYFLVAVISPDTTIASASFVGAPRVEKLAPDASGALSIPLNDGRAEFDLYLGPQEYERLRSLGYQLSEVNQYASWLHAVVQPFAAIVTRVLLWMKHVSGLSYGWVIIIFGVAVRLLLWPLNQSAMRSSIRMQRIQPQLSEVQKKYKGDPKKQQEMLMKIYQSHGMTPFSPMMGCLPMLLPMPILFALYFVFLNTIEFRGVPFLWMHDISAMDPYYITPLVMGISMFALSWIGLRGTPPSAQTRMMSYMMPVVMTFMFLRFAAGLNLYYAVQNLAALPQQWLLSKERAIANPQNSAGSGGGSSGKSRSSGRG